MVVIASDRLGIFIAGTKESLKNSLAMIEFVFTGGGRVFSVDNWLKNGLV
jgi:hypothetical protein